MLIRSAEMQARTERRAREDAAYELRREQVAHQMLQRDNADTRAWNAQFPDAYKPTWDGISGNSLLAGSGQAIAGELYGELGKSGYNVILVDNLEFAGNAALALNPLTSTAFMKGARVNLDSIRLNSDPEYDNMVRVAEVVVAAPSVLKAGGKYLATNSDEILGFGKNFARNIDGGVRIPTIGGRKPINSGYAGKTHPSGVKFNEQGFPDFTPYAKAEFKIGNLTGRYADDAAFANARLGVTETPRNYVWHHVENGVTMQLIPRSIHNAARHTGGSATIRNGGFD